jgi:hypothetical protein
MTGMVVPTSGRRSPKSSRLDELDMAPPLAPAVSSIMSHVLVSLHRLGVLLKLAIGLFPWDLGGRRQLHRPLSKLPTRGRAARHGGERDVMWGLSRASNPRVAGPRLRNS